MEKKKKSEGVTATRAEKKDRTKNLIRETLSNKEYKHNDLIDETAKIYAERFKDEETENINDVRGRIGSVLDIMKKEGGITYEGGVYALKADEKPQETKKPARKTAKKTAEKAENAEKEGETQKKPQKRSAKKKSEQKEEVELPVLPIEPVLAPIVITEPEQEKTEEKPEETAKKRGRRKKTESKAEVKTEVKTEETKAEEIKEIKAEKVQAEGTEEPATEETKPEERTEVKVNEPVEEKKALIEKSVVDMSFLFGTPKTVKPVQPRAEREIKEREGRETAEPKTETVKKEEKTPKPVEEPKKTVEEQKKPIAEAKKTVKILPKTVKNLKEMKKPLTADERLKEAYLKRLHRLGGDYFEYYSVYLLERYCRVNGRRLESLKISAGDRDGGIDGEIELTDKFGFRETIYIQAKNWDPEKGDEKLWVVGETLLQQFIGACACRQAKEGKQHCRGIFITTSRFTAEAKAILESMSEKIIGYDGTDLFEAAKECSFGLLNKNGTWVLDEDLLSGGKAFFTMF